MLALYTVVPAVLACQPAIIHCVLHAGVDREAPAGAAAALNAGYTHVSTQPTTLHCHSLPACPGVETQGYKDKEHVSRKEATQYQGKWEVKNKDSIYSLVC